jgi:hypothetical protein
VVEGNLSLSALEIDSEQAVLEDNSSHSGRPAAERSPGQVAASVLEQNEQVVALTFAAGRTALEADQCLPQGLQSEDNSALGENSCYSEVSALELGLLQALMKGLALALHEHKCNWLPERIFPPARICTSRS